MEIVFLGIELDGILAMHKIEEEIPAQYIAISSDTSVLKLCKEETIKYSDRLPVDNAVSRIASKIKRSTQNADIIFAFSGITGKKGEDTIPLITKVLEDKTVVSVVWYPKQKHGQKGIESTLERLEETSSVVAIPSKSLSALIQQVAELTHQILRMYGLPYANADADAGKRILGECGLLHLVQRKIPVCYINRENEKFSWGMECVNYCPERDTLLEYSDSALLHLVIPEIMPHDMIRYICEYVFSRLGDRGEFNFTVTPTPELIDTVIIELLATNTVTYKETELWY